MGNLCLGERKAGIHQIGLCLVYQSDLGDFQSLKPLKPSPHQCLALISVPLEDPEGRSTAKTCQDPPPKFIQNSRPSAQASLLPSNEQHPPLPPLSRGFARTATRSVATRPKAYDATVGAHQRRGEPRGLRRRTSDRNVR